MSKRIYSLDVLRGVAIAIMLFLDAPPDKIYPILEHAPWAGMTVPDVALPMFAFAMGAGAAISMSRRETSTKKILRRAAFMFAIGLFLAFLPKVIALLFHDDYSVFAWQTLKDYVPESFFDAVIIHGRLFGVLQRLAVIYAAGILIARAVRNEFGILIAAVALLILSSAGFHLYAPENSFAEAHNISRAVDFIFPGENHIYTPTHDPEGLYGSIAATASVLFGFLAGKILIDNATSRDKIFLLTAAGVAALIAGGLWTNFDIVSKKLWTAPFTLINAGGDFLLLALFTKFEAAAKKFLQPFGALGTNPLFFFVANQVVLIFMVMLPKEYEGGIYLWLYDHTTEGILSPEFGATLFCVLWLLMWLPLGELFYKMKIIIKL
ncbi:MAG: DUF1624 domain-containing protein [Selenomonadaceae bacterium]|nr:DUF1624 domain-containing protein [Selenomonadaceae bacterium]